ncbi:MAG: leucine-rich repeat domain-containing protein, partial [Bacteroidales bacterium]|nr:leucine-rich repeat domain-containing protein [Bacteroidales bacterium]
PNSVTSIGDLAFGYCTALESITIPNSVTSIGDNVFSGCTALESIIFEDNSKLTSIKAGLFKDLTSLKSITIPNSVTSIGDEAFNGCTSLKSITIPNSVTSIFTKAFMGCTSLTSISLPASLTILARTTFQSCPNITSVFVKGNTNTTNRFNDSPNAIIYRCGTDFDYEVAIPEEIDASKIENIVGYCGNNVYVKSTEALTLPEDYFYTATPANKYSFNGNVFTNISADIELTATKPIVSHINTSYTYTGSAFEPEITVDGLTLGTDYTVTYTNNINAGTASVYIDGINGGRITREFTINKAVPTYTIPENLSIKCSQTLADITLPEGFVFDDLKATLTLGETNSLSATFTHEDAKNYEVVKGIEIKIAVADHVPAETVKENEKTPTCETNGSYDEVVYCSVCGKELSRISKTSEAIEPPEPNPSTPVSSITDAPSINVWSYNSIIYIENAPDTEYKIIDLNGRTIKSATTKSTKDEININQSGIVILIIGNQSYKLTL